MLERGDTVAAAWRGRYDSLRLHTIRSPSGLRGAPIPRAEGRWVSRDGLIRYLERYAAANGLDIRTETAVTRIDRSDDRWRIATPGGPLSADAVVVATGNSNVPFLPDWPGRAEFGGGLIHSADYRNPEPYVGQDVLVVGSGNSGREIATNLADAGAARVRLSVRTPPHIVWRDRAGFPAQVLGLTLGRLPVRVGDTLGRTLRRLTIPDLSAQGLPRPIVGPATHFRTTGHEVVPGVEAFRRDGVVLADGSVVQPDVVIARPASRPGSSRWSVISVSSMRREGRS